jgi:hypothetical protein
MRYMRFKIALIGSFAFGIGCQDQGHFTPDMATDLSQSGDRILDGDPLPRPPTDHPALPLLTSTSGRIVANMKAHLVVWPDYPDIAERAREFMQWMLQSEYWTDTLGEYGVGPGSLEQLITLSSAPPTELSDSMIQSMLAKMVEGGQIPIDDNTVVFFLTSPASTVRFQGDVGCGAFGGYHWETTVGTSRVSYAVIVQCGTADPDPFDAISTTISHEASEVATDPRPSSASSWHNVDTGLEISDLCQLLPIRLTATVPGADAGTKDVTYQVTRNYSNRAARQGDEDPCKPVSPSAPPYYGVALDPLVIDIARDENFEGKFIAEIKPYAFGEVGPIEWRILQTSGGLSFDPDRGVNNPGDTVRVVVNVNPSLPSSAQLLYVVGRSEAGGRSVWAGAARY